MSFFISDAMAQGAEGGQGDPFTMIIPLLLMFGIFYFLLIRPQQKKAKEHKNMVEALGKGDEVITAIEVSRNSVQLLFHDNDSYTFMDSKNYEQFMLSADALEDDAAFLYDGLEGLSALISEGELLGVELPTTMSLEISECAPAMKAASSSARTKPATLTTGLVIQVPEYLTPGEIIRINTETREFISRA